MSDPRLSHIRETAEPEAPVYASPSNSSVTPEQASLTAIDLLGGFVIANIGTAQLTVQEVVAIRKIATKAFKRAMATMISRMSGQTVTPSAEPAKRRGRPPGKKRGRKPGRPKGSLTASGKRRGRPPKVRPVENTAVPSAQTSLFTQEGADFQTPPAADTSPATA